ncbi:MAG: type III-B CRISPR-associated protein Cas10/Cmr2 [Nostocales cyanobacterium 94392]|nr:type III-B CRISPR-associated protein Cas10/Cmr2 [Nostocales cyanobacterium 94392]
MADEAIYTAITFAPVQGFIEKSRKLRDLYGASLILSYLSQRIVLAADNPPNIKVISPANINIQKGMPNRLLIKGDFTEDMARDVLLNAWQDILVVCRNWVEKKIPNEYQWEREWRHWGNHAWEIFWGRGDSIPSAMNDLETRKLSRNWTAINWIGESSSLTGADGIAFPRLGGANRNPKELTYRSEDDEIKSFYKALASITDNLTEEDSPGDSEEDNLDSETLPEGKFIDSSEQLSILELVKRLVTWKDVRDEIGKKFDVNNAFFESLPRGFKEIRRKPTETESGQWTGWFMGDGDEVGKKLKQLADSENGEEEIYTFTKKLRDWGKNFYQYFEREKKLGRVIYAGGDDFLGVIYSKNPKKPISGFSAFEWLTTLQSKWKEHRQDINVSVGFVWVAGSVPQRDILQHCRQAQKTAKNLNRDRVTIRVVFNSGQYVEWTCPWDYLHILTSYKDRNDNTYAEWERRDRESKYEPNWTHVFSDLAQLKARHAFGLAENRRRKNVDADTVNQSKIIDNRRDFLKFFDIYFPDWEEILKKNEKWIVGASNDASSTKRASLMIDWIEDLITIGWYLCSNTSSSLNL